jgi:hypothetical protein
MGATAHTPLGQAAGCGCMGFVALMVIAVCSGGGGGGADPSVDPPPAYPPVSGPAYPPDEGERVVRIPEPRDGLYIQGTLNVRAAPSRDAPILRKLQSGDYVLMGPPDANGWAQVYSGSEADGWAYRASELVQPTGPALSAPPPTRSGGGSRHYITGPRGGCYYINRNGNKTYVDHSFCY